MIQNSRSIYPNQSYFNKKTYKISDILILFIFCSFINKKRQYKFYLRMINQKIVQKAFYTLRKALEAVYFLGSLWISIIFICTIPIWAPLYLLIYSMSRSANFIKRIIQLPKQLFRPKITEPIRYAVLKGSGRYLKNTDDQDAFLSQLYDYALRKFLSLQEIDPQKKIAEIQCETLTQWKYFIKNGIKNIKCLQSKPEILEKQRQTCTGIEIKKESYNIDQLSQEFDTIIALNIKQKLNKYSNRVEDQQKIDVLKILRYLKHHLSNQGYVIFGDFFEEEGQIKVLEELFHVFGFEVQQSENIQKNISYAEKLMKYKSSRYWEEKILQKLALKVKQFTGVKRDSKKFFVMFILRKIVKLEVKKIEQNIKELANMSIIEDK